MREKRDKAFAKGFDEGYEQFKIGVVLRQAQILMSNVNPKTFAVLKSLGGFFVFERR
jgi:accessory colonization factor AcfC